MQADDLHVEQQLTFRSLFVGCLLGSIVGASNMYLGLTIGWTFGASLFGSILGFSILKPISKYTGKYFGPKENCTVQTAATSAGGLHAGFVSAIPAMYRLGLLSKTVTEDFVVLLLWALSCAYFGLFFAIPLRRYFIINQNLPFPSPSIAANTITNLHSTQEGETGVNKKAKALLYSFILALVIKATVWFVPVIVEWHIFYYIGQAASSPSLMDVDLVWLWRLELSLAFLAAGFLIGSNTASSYFSGTVLAWAIMGPILLALDVVRSAYGFPSLDPNNPGVFNVSLNEKPSAQFWLLWPGVTIMIVSSFAELISRWRIVMHSFGGFKKVFQRNPTAAELREKFELKQRKVARDDSETLRLVDGGEEEDDVHDEKKAMDIDEDSNEDPAGPSEQVPFLWWSSGLLASSIFTVVVLTVFFKVPVFQSILSIFIGFLLAFVGTQSTGETDINPTGTIGKTSQFVFAAFRSPDVNQMLRTNLIAGSVASSCAAQTVDMVGDLKTGHILRASPRVQFIAQSVGSFVTVFVSVGLFTLFGASYPCLLEHVNTASASCQFQAPAVASWTAVSVAMTAGISESVPISAAYSCIVAAILTILITIAKYRFITPSNRHYIPNLNAVGIAMVNPQPYIGVSIFSGSLISLVCARRWPRSFEMFAFAIASGLVAGEGIGGILEAGYVLGGLKRKDWVVGWGIPQNGTEVAW